MDADRVLSLLAAFRGEGIDVWIAGGWGIDALVGKETRVHGDIDLLHRAEDESRLTGLLEGLGFRETLDWRPARYVMTGSDGAEIDLHPLEFQEDGSALQGSLREGEPFRYPAECFAEGVIGGTRVHCVSVAQQIEFHRGYEPRSVDMHDMALLRKAFGVETHF